MQFKAIIVDDETHSRSVLKNLLAKFCPSIHLVAEAEDVNNAFDLINKHKPDVVFLDIQMPGGNGFSLLKKFKAIYFDVVFVTSYDKYAIEAIKLSALYYLLKPIEVEDLQEAVKRLERNLSSKKINEKLIANAITNSEEKNDIERKITVHTRDQILFIGLNEITHFEAYENYTFIYTKENVKYTSEKILSDYENLLKEYEAFYRIGKGCMINVNYVHDYSKGETCILTLANKHTFEISRRKKQELLALLKLKI
jgi:two-component system, LytTR family, response regulator